MAPNIEFDRLTKAYPTLTAVAELSCQVQPGRVTGFLGPNGAGKSTALRCLLGLAQPTSGRALIGGRPYAELTNPLRTVGAVLDSRGFHAGLTGRQCLSVVAAAAGIESARIGQVLSAVDLDHAAGQRTGSYSLGMRQRLAIASALLGDPDVLVLDEPANGLDPIGIAWLRDLLRAQAAQGRTVLVSSHQLAEMEHTVDNVIVMHQGRLLVQGSIDDVRAGRTLEAAFMDMIRGAA